MLARYMAFAVLEIGSALVWAGNTGEETAGDGDLRIRIRLHDSAAVPDRILHEAQETSRLFGAAGIQAAWTNCHHWQPPVLIPGDPCNESKDPLAFTLVISKASSGPLGTSSMGFAMPFVGNANHAAVLYPSVEEQAYRWWPVSTGMVLGHVMAHEIAHLILGSLTHGRGIMKSNWTRNDARLMVRRKLLFTAGQASALRAALVKRLGGHGTMARSW